MQSSPNHHALLSLIYAFHSCLNKVILIFSRHTVLFYILSKIYSGALGDFHPFRPILNLFWTHFWPIWTRFWPILDPFRAHFDLFWTHFRPILDPFWNHFGPNFSYTFNSVFGYARFLWRFQLFLQHDSGGFSWGSSLKTLQRCPKIWYFENLLKVTLEFVNWFSISTNYFHIPIALSSIFNFWSLSTRSQKELTMNWTKSCHLEWYWWIIF